MKILDQLTKQEIETIIKKVALNHATKKFGIHESNDIEQQAALICWEKISEFNFNKIKEHNIAQALENWLNKVVSNRLKNFYRDNYQNKRKMFRSDIGDGNGDMKKRESLLHPTSLNEVAVLNFICDPNNAEANEMLNKLVDSCSTEEIEILESILNGDKVGSYYKNKLMHKVDEIWINEEN